MIWLTKLWNGGFSLAKSCILFSIVGYLLSLCVTGFAAVFGSLVFYVVYLLGVIYCVVAFVGTWRSAARYEGNKLFAILARFVVVLGFFSLISNAYYGFR